MREINQVIFCKNRISPEEIKDILSCMPEEVEYRLVVRAPKENAFSAMIAMHGVTTISFDTLEEKAHYDFNFKTKQYLRNGKSFHLTPKEASAVYQRIVNGALLDDYSDIASNFRKRFRDYKVFLELNNGTVANISNISMDR